MTKQVLIAHAKAVSLKVVAETIAKFLKSRDYTPMVTCGFNPRLALSYPFESIFFVVPVDPVYANEYAGYHLIMSPKFGDKLIWYATVEGRIHCFLGKKPVWYNIKFTPNSQYTATKLQEMGYNVGDIVYHGYDPEEVKQAKTKARQLREQLERDMPDTVRFGIVSSTHPRKNMDGLLTAIALLSAEVREKCRFLFITEPELKHKLPTKECLYIADMGSLKHVDVLAFMAAVDFVIHPSQSEGFGLPVLESMAVGTPVIHCWYPPLSEFSTKEGNITFPYNDIIELEGKGGLIFELHTYSPEVLAEAIKKAYDTFLNDTKTYRKMKQLVENHAKNYSIFNVYSKFIELIEG